MQLNRAIMQEFETKVKPGKVLLLHGARRVGKTALVLQYLKGTRKDRYILLSGEDQRANDLLAEQSIENYRRLLGSIKLMVIDEAHKIPDIGWKLKLMVDSFPDVAFIATGSSVFDMSNKLGEPLVGRAYTLMLYPLAQMEFQDKEHYLQTLSKLEEKILLGGYPELQHYADRRDKEEYLRELVNSYLLKDILEFEGIRKADKILDILRMLAFQIGHEVNVAELASNAKGISRNTVEIYLDLLSKVFIIYRVPGFSRNLRKEVTKMDRWYFYDNGVRNALINNFNPLKLRNDTGQLWENYIMAERIKHLRYTRRYTNRYFWRTYDQQEIDLIEEKSGALNAYEFKWNPKKKTRAPLGWTNNYPDATFDVINPENHLDFITE